MQKGDQTNTVSFSGKKGGGGSAKQYLTKIILMFGF